MPLLTKNQKSMFCICAVAAPLLHTTSGCSWPAVAVVGGVCLALCAGLDVLAEQAQYPAWYGWLHWVWGTVVISQLLLWIAPYWPTARGPGIALLLLALSTWTACKGEAVTSCCAAVLGLFVLAVAGILLLTGVGEVEPQELMPYWQIPDGNLITVFLLPALLPNAGGRQGKLWLLLLGLLASSITMGVLGSQNCWAVDAPFYELSRSLNLFGVAKRLDSVTAAVMTLGFYLTMCYVLLCSRPENSGRSECVSALLCGVILLCNFRLDSRFVAAGSVIAWVILPILFAGKRKFKKSDKSA